MIRSIHTVIRRLTAVPLALVTALVAVPVFASSHMDAPLVVLDPAANTTDVYAFVSSEGGKKYLVAALSVYPFEEPGIGPNKFNFDDRVLYEIHVATGEGVKTGEAGHSYQFRFRTRYKDQGTILQSYRGVVMDLDDDAQNLTQDFTVTRICRGCRRHRHGVTALGEGKVPPNNQGNATPLYNQDDDGEKPARDGVADLALLDRYTRQGIFDLAGGYQVFCGQREDGFYADIQAIFDLLKLRNPGVDSQMGFNLHTIVLRIPLEDLGGDRQVAGVYATTSRKRITILRGNGYGGPPSEVARFVQVGRH